LLPPHASIAPCTPNATARFTASIALASLEARLFGGAQGVKPSLKSSPDLLQERGPLFGSGLSHVVMAEIHASVLFSGAVTRLTGRLMKLARPVPFHATRNTNSPHTFAFQRASRAELARLALLRPRASECAGERIANAH